MKQLTQTANLKWVNVWERGKRSHCAFNFFIGARGTGKTYGALLHQHEDFTSHTCGKFIYMRMTQTELDICATDEDNPYKKLNTRENWNVQFEPVPKSKAYSIVDDGEVIGTARALATFANVRGSDFSDYTDIVFDEFAPAERVRKTPEIKNAGYLFAQAYETINRNRELENEDPVRVYFLANSFRLDSDILYYWGLIPVIEAMLKSGQKRVTIPERSIYIELCDAVEVSEAKRQTVLYRALKGNKHIENVNLNNKFNDYNLTLVKAKVPLSEYIPVVCVDDITIYSHKTTGELYARVGRETCKEMYDEKSRGQFASRWRVPIRTATQQRMIYADNAHTLYKLQDIIDNPTS